MPDYRTDRLVMEHRTHRRLPASLEVKVAEVRHREQPAHGTLIDVSKAGIGVLLPVEMKLDTVVRLEVADSVLFGHVVYSNALEDGWRTGIAVEQVLLGTSDITRLVQAVLKEEMPATPGLEAELGPV